MFNTNMFKANLLSFLNFFLFFPQSLECIPVRSQGFPLIPFSSESIRSLNLFFFFCQISLNSALPSLFPWLLCQFSLLSFFSRQQQQILPVSRVKLLRKFLVTSLPCLKSSRMYKTPPPQVGLSALPTFSFLILCLKSPKLQCLLRNNTLFYSIYAWTDPSLDSYPSHFLLETVLLTQKHSPSILSVKRLSISFGLWPLCCSKCQI